MAWQLWKHTKTIRKKKTKEILKNKITRRKLNDMQDWLPKEERKKEKNIWKLDFLKIDNSTNVKECTYIWEHDTRRYIWNKIKSAFKN